ncbi:uncharacterized protein NECHADRAFT_51515, partial [Fusarium vanettenii 77-13-4]
MLLESGASFFRGGGVHGSILQAAAFNGHLDTVQLLLDAGADDSIGGYTKDALHAAIEGGHPDIVLLLLTRGFPPRPRDRLRGKEQWPALLRQACSVGADQAVKRILRHGVNPNEADGNGDYPLHLAAAHLQSSVVNTLIQHGADMNVTTHEGKTPL